MSKLRPGLTNEIDRKDAEKKRRKRELRERVDMGVERRSGVENIAPERPRSIPQPWEPRRPS